MTLLMGVGWFCAGFVACLLLASVLESDLFVRAGLIRRSDD